MHPSALRFGSLFFSTYCIKSTEKVVIDIGSQDVNGSLRAFCPEDAHYVGVDFVKGNNVDVVLKDPYKLPFEDESVDFIVCSSVFEHSQFFWLLFLEIIRILKPEGIFYLNVPSNGYIHRYPLDSWRFYPDSGLALVAWAERNGYTPALLESFIGDKNFQIDSQETWWNDYCAVFIKNVKFSYLHPNRILKQIENYTNAHCDDLLIQKNEKFLTDDFLLIQDANSKIVNLELKLAKYEKDSLVLSSPVSNSKNLDDFFNNTITFIKRMASESVENNKKIFSQWQHLQSDQAEKNIKHNLAYQERDNVRLSQLDQARFKIEEQLTSQVRREKEISERLEESHRKQVAQEEKYYLANKKIDALILAQLDQAKLADEIQLATYTRLEKDFNEKIEQLYRKQAEQKNEYDLVSTKRSDQLVEQLNQSNLQLENQLAMQTSLEKEFNEQIGQLHREQAVQKIENDLVYTNREKALVTQLDQARQRIENQLVIQASREKEICTHLKQLDIEKTAQKIASDLVYTKQTEELLAQIDHARLQIEDQFAMQKKREKEIDEKLNKLCSEQSALMTKHDSKVKEMTSIQAAQLALTQLQMEKQLTERALREKEFLEKTIEIRKNEANTTTALQKKLNEEHEKLGIAEEKIAAFTLENQYLKNSYLKRLMLKIKNKNKYN